MEIFTEYELPGFLDFAASFFAAVPIGFLLAMFLGLLAFGVFKLLSLFKYLISGRN